MNEVEQYIRSYASSIGIDPDIAVRVAQHEGGLANPYRRGEGPAPRSQAQGLGSTENSYGPFQLYVSGTGAGLGDRALAAGVDPTKDWKGGVRFGLDEVKNKGWGQWYGAKAAGITGFDGVHGKADPNAHPDNSPVAPMVADGAVVNNTGGTPNASPEAPAGILAILNGKKDSDSGDTKGGLLNAIAQLQPEAPQFIQYQGGAGNGPQLSDYLDSYKKSIKRTPFQTI